MARTRGINGEGSCGCCVFWELVAGRADEGYQDEGLCRRHAPVAVPSTAVQRDGNDVSGEKGIMTAWPRTFAESDWCGDYVVKGDIASGREKGG